MATSKHGARRAPLSASQYFDHINSDWARAWFCREQDRDGVFVPRLFVRLCKGNMTDAYVFSQIMYWSGLTNCDDPERSVARLRYWRDGNLWIVKTQYEWADELALNSQYTVRDSLARLVKANLIVRKSWTSNVHHRMKATFVRVDWEGLEAAVAVLEKADDPLQPDEEYTTDYVEPLDVITDDVDTDAAGEQSNQTTDNVAGYDENTRQGNTENIATSDAITDNHQTDTIPTRVSDTIQRPHQENTSREHAALAASAAAMRPSIPLLPANVPSPLSDSDTSNDPKPEKPLHPTTAIQYALIEIMTDTGLWEGEVRPGGKYFRDAGTVAKRLLKQKPDLTPDDAVEVLKATYRAMRRQGKANKFTIMAVQNGLEDWESEPENFVEMRNALVKYMLDIGKWSQPLVNENFADAERAAWDLCHAGLNIDQALSLARYVEARAGEGGFSWKAKTIPGFIQEWRKFKQQPQYADPSHRPVVFEDEDAAPSEPQIDRDTGEELVPMPQEAKDAMAAVIAAWSGGGS